MQMFDNFIKRAKPIDIGLLKLSSLVFGMFLVAFFPELLVVPAWLFLVIAIVLWIKPGYAALKK